LFGDALAQQLVDSRNASLTVQFNKVVPFSHDFEFALNHSLVADEGPIEVVRKRHVSARFPIADRLGLAKFAAERGFRTDVQPKGEMRAKRHGIKPTHVVAVDTSHDAAADQSKNVTIGEHDG